MEEVFKSVTTQVINLMCSYDYAWTFLSDPLFQKEWGKSFFIDIYKTGTGFTAVTRFGEMNMQVVSDKKSGVIDTYMNQTLTNPSRLIKQSENACIYVFTLFKPAVATPEMFQSQGIPNLKEDLKNLKRILEDS